MNEHPFGTVHPEDERLLDLLANHATHGLANNEQAELQELLVRYDAIDDSYFALAATAIEVATLTAPPAASTEVEPFPPDLAERLASDAGAFFEVAGPQTGTAQTGTAQTGTAKAGARAEPIAGSDEPSFDGNVTSFEQRLQETSDRQSAPQPRFGSSGRSGWWAAAACALLAIAGWWSFLRAPGGAPEIAPSEPPPIIAEVPAEEPSIQERVDRALDAVVLPLGATEDEAATGATGELVWSSALQTGYMRVRDLAMNDPRQSQYQLWIFDATRDERYPVSGGVFDVAGTEVMLAVEPEIPIEDPRLFALTVEKPGGVVVSDRERIVLTAAVPGSTAAG